jgi:hypoxanthine phosphoribosyltransferase
MNRAKSKDLSVSTFTRLENIFNEKQWPIDEKSQYGLFNRFCKTLTTLDPNQQEFILDLTQRFTYIPLSNYFNELVNVFQNLIDNADKDKILVINCLPPSQYGYVKSNYLISYIAKGVALKHNVDFKNKKIKVIDSIKALLKYNDLSTSMLVFVDDFIGTGKTAIDAILYVQHRLQVNEKKEPKYSVLSIAAMEEGINELKRLRIPVYCSHELKKGISDYYFGNELVSAKEMMKSISLSIKNVKENFAMGFGSSEALICMERCPNNTFPIFWKGKKTAPYER